MSKAVSESAEVPISFFSAVALFRVVLILLISYFAVSILTLPFGGKVWLGEIPLPALIQLPKLNPAHWFRKHIVILLIDKLGYSSGSFSPDFLLARPYGLLFPYAVLMACILAVLFYCRARAQNPGGKGNTILVVALLFFIIPDYFATLKFADGPGFSMY